MEKDNKYTRDGDKRFTLRIEQTLFDKLEASARACKRSIGRQIEYILDCILNNKASNDILLEDYLKQIGIDEDFDKIIKQSSTKKSDTDSKSA